MLLSKSTTSLRWETWVARPASWRPWRRRTPPCPPSQPRVSLRPRPALSAGSRWKGRGCSAPRSGPAIKNLINDKRILKIKFKDNRQRKRFKDRSYLHFVGAPRRSCLRPSSHHLYGAWWPATAMYAMTALHSVQTSSPYFLYSIVCNFTSVLLNKIQYKLDNCSYHFLVGSDNFSYQAFY